MDGPQSGMAMAKINLPFIWFWRQGAEVRAADREVDASESMVRAAMLETSAMVETEIASLRTTRAQLLAIRRVGLPSADKALKLGLTGYQAGSVGVSDALGAVKAYLMTNLENVGLSSQIGRSVAGLEALTGANPMTQHEMESSHAER